MVFTAAKVATAHDSNDDAGGIADAIQILVTGNAVVVTPNDVAITITGAPVGAIFPIRVKRVNSTGTTASVLMLYGPASY